MDGHKLLQSAKITDWWHSKLKFISLSDTRCRGVLPWSVDYLQVCLWCKYKCTFSAILQKPACKILYSWTSWIQKYTEAKPKSKVLKEAIKDSLFEEVFLKDTYCWTQMLPTIRLWMCGCGRFQQEHTPYTRMYIEIDFKDLFNN